jgi:hypothetical protein
VKLTPRGVRRCRVNKLKPPTASASTLGEISLARRAQSQRNAEPPGDVLFPTKFTVTQLSGSARHSNDRLAVRKSTEPSEPHQEIPAFAVKKLVEFPGGYG